MPLETGASLGFTKKIQSHKRRGKTFWVKTLNDFEHSPLSLQDFCAERGLAVSTFHGWRRRLSAAKETPQKIMKEASKTQPQFLPVYVTSPERPPAKSGQPDMSLPSGLSIQINDGLKISIDKNFHVVTLQRLLKIFSSGVPSAC